MSVTTEMDLGAVIIVDEKRPKNWRTLAPIKGMNPNLSEIALRHYQELTLASKIECPPLDTIGFIN